MIVFCCVLPASNKARDDDIDVNHEYRSVSTTRVHGPSSRAELTARELWCIF